MWTTTISHLPEELLNVILSRTGFKSRRSVRLTCKKWNNLFKNQSFIGEDATTREGESKMILLRDNTLYLMSIVMENGGGDALTEQKGRLLHGAFFIDEAKRVAMILDKTWNGEDTFHIMGDAGYGKEVSLGEPEDKLFYHPLVCSYAPSLVQIELSPGFQRKQQSDLEKRRCDENISRFVSHEEELTKRLLYAEAIEKGIREGGIGL
ncbi:putative F-box protein At3g22421 [Capsella rubella]|uniref:putative F-box protein At3g22421 n=1 Tax=Capsella rubella TaxID=81985 RepID=UPI000CD5086F|nr:putative F-box protein At3g22421 [Capsella rubella]